MDRLTPEQRHRCMSHIRGKNTSPEMVVRRFLHAHGFRYSLHKRNLPGSPDIVLRKYRTVVFVNGCFWHGHMVSIADGSSGSRGSRGSRVSSGSSTSEASPMEPRANGSRQVPCKYFVMPKGTFANGRNVDPLFWKHKIELNQARDYRERVELELMGWKVITVWECELKSKVREGRLNRLIKELR